MAVFSETNFKVIFYSTRVFGHFYFTLTISPTSPPWIHAWSTGWNLKNLRVHVSIFRLPLEEELKAMEVVWHDKKKSYQNQGYHGIKWMIFGTVLLFFSCFFFSTIYNLLIRDVCLMVVVFPLQKKVTVTSCFFRLGLLFASSNWHCFVSTKLWKPSSYKSSNNARLMVYHLPTIGSVNLRSSWDSLREDVSLNKHPSLYHRFMKGGCVNSRWYLGEQFDISV